MGHNLLTELYIFFPPAARLWALEPDFHCEGRKKREFALFSFMLGAFAFFALFFLASRSRARMREKSAGAHLCMCVL
jgi:hypothetical protein